MRSLLLMVSSLCAVVMMFTGCSSTLNSPSSGTLLNSPLRGGGLQGNFGLDRPLQARREMRRSARFSDDMSGMTCETTCTPSEMPLDSGGCGCSDCSAAAPAPAPSCGGCGGLGSCRLGKRCGMLGGGGLAERSEGVGMLGRLQSGNGGVQLAGGQILGGRVANAGGRIGCGRGGCGFGNKLCGSCAARARGLHGGHGGFRGAHTKPYGGTIPHTAAPPTFNGGPGGGGVPQYVYPYYTTRGPRDFLMPKPPSIGY